MDLITTLHFKGHAQVSSAAPNVVVASIDLATDVLGSPTNLWITSYVDWTIINPVTPTTPPYRAILINTMTINSGVLQTGSGFGYANGVLSALRNEPSWPGCEFPSDMTYLIDQSGTVINYRLIWIGGAGPIYIAAGRMTFDIYW